MEPTKLEDRFEEVLSDGSILIFEYLFEERSQQEYPYTNGLRYKLVLIVKWADSEPYERILLYDNYHASKPHIHVYGVEEKEEYEFSGIENLLLDFLSEARTLTGLNLEDWIREVGNKVLNSPFKKFW